MEAISFTGAEPCFRRSTPEAGFVWDHLGTIGAALPNAIGLQLANPDAQVAMITGDASLGFYIAELDTAVRHELPIVIIVGNDAGWGLERELQGPADTAGCELRATRYDIVMQGFGGEGENITALDQIGPALGRGPCCPSALFIQYQRQGRPIAVHEVQAWRSLLLTQS